MLIFRRYIKASLLPDEGNSALICCTKPITDIAKPRFGENFPLPVPLNKLRTKTLQVNVWNIVHDQSRECLVSKISLVAVAVCTLAENKCRFNLSYFVRRHVLKLV